MKKIVWIVTVNANGVYPLGYTGGLLIGNLLAEKSQKELKSDLGPEIDLEFTSYNMSDPKTLEADLILYNDSDEKYIDDQTKARAKSVPYSVYGSGDLEDIKKYIESELP